MDLQIAEFVATALSQRQLSGLSEMLRSIAQSMNAMGSILWGVAPGSDPAKRRGSLQVLAEWFPGEQGSLLFSLPLDRSRTGEAVATGQPQAVGDTQDSGVYPDPFFTAAGIRCFCCVPVRFDDGSRGSLNLYRDRPQPFNCEEIKTGEGFAGLVPGLYQTIRDRVSFNLLHEVTRRLHQAEVTSSRRLLDRAEINTVVREICELMKDALQCIEASVFLEDRLAKPGTFELVASTWPFPVSKRLYRRDVADGLTGWVLERAKAVRIPNLSRWKEERASIRRRYPGLNWNDPLSLAKAVSRILSPPARDWLPLSFLAVPIVNGERIDGVIRCSVAQQSPYYFGGHEENLLTLVAAQIGRFWSSWMSRREVEQEKEIWKGLVERMRELNSFVLRELSEDEPNERRIFSAALQVTSTAIAGAEIMDVRLLDEEAKELYFAEGHGMAWMEGTPSDLQARRDRRFPIGDASRPSAGSRVVETGAVYEIPDVRNDRYYSETFPKTRRMIVAPMISVADKGSLMPKVLGVLDIRGTDERDFPPYAKDIAWLLGSQLGLYHELARTIVRLQSLRVQQVQTFQDLKHQFKTPVVQAFKRIDLLLKRPAIDDSLRDELLKIRGLIGKAMRVSLSSGLFVSLAKGEPLRLESSEMTPDDLVKLLIEAGQDNKLMSDPKRRLTFRVDRNSIERIPSLTVDRGLLEQAIYDLLDNAFKYSYSGTEVRIFGGVTGTGRVHITVVNSGIPISKQDVPRCVERGWQSEEAQSVSGSGSGIGLWIVDHIVKAHGGELQIVPTRSNGETEIKLLLPKGAYR